MRGAKRTWAGFPGILAVALLGLGCDDGDAAGPPSGERATVEFVYEASTAVDPEVEAQFPECVEGVGRTHIHPGWRGFDRFDMTAVGADRWEIAFDDVPVGTEQRIRVSDPNVCAENPTGAATENVRANGVLLTRVVDTPGAGVEPGLAFTVSADGTVTP